MSFVMGRRKRSDAGVFSNAMSRRKRIKLSNSHRPMSVSVVENQGVAGDVVRVTLVGCKATGRVLFLEAGDDFVEVLLSFLALPVGSVVKLLSKEGVEGGLNGVSNILDSLDKFSDLLPYVDKLALMDDRKVALSSSEIPRMPEDVLQLVPSNVSAVKDVVLYECRALCNRVSTRQGARCPCNAYNGSFSKLSLFTLALSPEQDLKKKAILYDCGAHCNRVSANFGSRCPCNTSSGYFFDLSLLTLIVSAADQSDSKMIESKLAIEPARTEDSVKKRHVTYIVTDSLEISPNSIAKSISILSDAKVEQVSDLTSMKVPVTPRQILQLLRASITSKTALSCVFGSQITVMVPPSDNPPLESSLGQDKSESTHVAVMTVNDLRFLCSGNTLN
ncbi:hypothetical protein KC19_2G183800 [Ceratodon purpureus]|uniref:Uncharacterized protein n=1 Tax=Ceratodon purpureus TaxID=3225 RepID=A0A8T0IXQ6_CERPU|nr:hypothetical protein KC19_2G183800 [Ceratodon purpureus]